MSREVLTVKLDRTEELRLLQAFAPRRVEEALKDAGKTSSKAAKAVLAPRAPEGTAARLSQYYRRMGLAHGAFRRSVRAAAIRGRHSALRDLQGRTIGYVIGPLGKNAFTRAWIEFGTQPHGRHPGQAPRPWVEEAAAAAFAVARSSADAVLSIYARRAGR